MVVAKLKAIKAGLQRRALQVMLADEKLVAALQQDFGQEAALNFLRDLAVPSSGLSARQRERKKSSQQAGCLVQDVPPSVLP